MDLRYENWFASEVSTTIFKDIMTILIYACKKSFSALRENAFGALTSLRLQSFAYSYAFIQFMLRNNQDFAHKIRKNLSE